MRRQVGGSVWFSPTLPLKIISIVTKAKVVQLRITFMAFIEKKITLVTGQQTLPLMEIIGKIQ